MTFKIAHQDALTWETREHNNFLVYFKRLATHTHSKELGVTLFRLPPGKKPYPYHFHHANEEAIYVLSGSGKIRVGKEVHSVKAGDFFGFPTGPEYAHQTMNDSEEDLVYLCISTMIAPEVSEYPDSNKVGIITGTAPGLATAPGAARAFFPKTSQVDYYYGEE